MGSNPTSDSYFGAIINCLSTLGSVKLHFFSCIESETESINTLFFIGARKSELRPMFLISTVLDKRFVAIRPKSQPPVLYRKNSKVILHIQKIYNLTQGRDRIVVSTLRCGRNNPGSNPGHGILPFELFPIHFVFILQRPENLSF